jgi:1,4-alpha-glucan branching enzyme
MAYHRWHQTGPGDDVVVVVNLSHNAQMDYRLGFPADGIWRVRFNSDWRGYSPAFANTTCDDVTTTTFEKSSNPPESNDKRDGFLAEGKIRIGPYSILVLSQDAVVL